MVGEDLEGHFVLLLRPVDLVVELGVVEGKAAVDGERLGSFLVVLNSMEYNQHQNIAFQSPMQRLSFRSLSSSSNKKDMIAFFISAPICQNAFPSHLVKNDFRVFSESLGSPPSSTQTLVVMAGL